jgi:hypothetical protein
MGFVSNFHGTVHHEVCDAATAVVPHFVTACQDKLCKSRPWTAGPALGSLLAAHLARLALPLNQTSAALISVLPASQSL